MPCASASFLKAASQASKLPVLRQRGAASAGPASTAAASIAAPVSPKIRCHIAAAPIVRMLANCAIRLVTVKFADIATNCRPIARH